MLSRAALACFLQVFGVLSAPPDSRSDVEKTPFSSAKLPSERELLEKARSANGDLYAALKSFVCREEIERFKGDLRGAKARVIDHVSANLSFENGVEHYYNIQQNTRSRPNLAALSGAWSEGEFGTLLQQTGKLLEVQPVSFVAFDTLPSGPTAIYRFAVSEEDSPWDLAVGEQHFRIPFTTDVWISAATGEIVKIARKSISIPAETHITEIDWDVTLDAVNLSGKTWLLPIAAVYSVSYEESKRREWNKMSFSNYRRYGSESSLRFEGFQ